MVQSPSADSRLHQSDRKLPLAVTALEHMFPGELHVSRGAGYGRDAADGYNPGNPSVHVVRLSKSALAAGVRRAIFHWRQQAD